MVSFRTWFTYRWRQILAVVLAASSLATPGSVAGWSVGIIRMMQDRNPPFSFTVMDQPWLVSCVGVAVIVTTLSTGWLVETFGPCRLLTSLLLSQGLAWILMAMLYSLPCLFVGRVITGCIGIMLITIVQPLIAELSQPDVRGMLSTLPEVALTVGLLGVYVLPGLMLRQASTLCGVQLLLALCMVLFVPESPYWLIKKGKQEEAERSLMRLRAPEHDIKAEVTVITEGLAHHSNEEGSFLQQIRALRDEANFRPVILLSVLIILKEVGGVMFIFLFTPLLFVFADVTGNFVTTAVIIGVTRLLFTFVSALIVDKVGRRPLLIFSSITCGVAMYVIGGFISSANMDLAWINLVAAFVFIASFGLGVGPVPWILVGEMLPTPVRFLSSSICTCVLVVFTFSLLSLWPSHDMLIAEFLGVVLLSLGTSYVLLAAVTWLCVPETRNRSLEDLQTAFTGLSQRSSMIKERYFQANGPTFSKPDPSQGMNA